MRMKTRSILILAVILFGLGMMIWLAGSVPSAAALEVMDHAKKNGIPYSKYPASLIELMERNPQTKSFVLNYPFREDKEADLSAYDPAQGMPLFIQWDEQWGYQPYADDFVAISGSGVMCLAMTGWYLSGGSEVYSPQRVAEFAWEKGYGTGRRLIRDCGSALGMEVTELAREERKVALYLKNGDPVIALMGSGDFTDSNHYIVLTSYSNGLVTVRDPNSRENSEKLWSYVELEAQTKSMWVIRLPQ